MANNILLIDDEELVVKSLSKLLSLEGYNVVVAQSGEEAIEKIKQVNFDLVVSDVRMPGTDGLETIKQIRTTLKKANKKSIPEILITGYADGDKYEEAVGLGIKDYLFKPFDNTELLCLVKKNIG